MRKFWAIAVLSAVVCQAKAEDLKFCWGASADAVSSYIWRGLYEGGLSFQPQISLGWESEHTSFDFGAWGSVGASDWGFRHGLEVEEGGLNPNTQLVKELDIFAGFNLWGATIGLTHYYYFDGENFFNFGDINEITGSAQTELSLGYDFSTLFPNVNLQLSWNTMIAGDDFLRENGKRGYSTYIEACYCQEFNHGMSLTGAVGCSPWRSFYTDGYEDYGKDFAFNNLTLRFDKSWSLFNDSCALDLYVQGTMNPCNLNKENAIIRASGDNKLASQKLMAAIGVNFSFSGK